MEEKHTSRKRLQTSILLILLAVASITAASYAWFSIADNTKLYSIGLDVTTGRGLRFDLDEHETFEEYVSVLPYVDIVQRIQETKGYNMQLTDLKPVTTSDCITFTFEDGSIADPYEGAYEEFDLHFMAQRDMIVHLTTANSSEDALDGTAFISTYEDFAPSMRLSFTVNGESIVYDPGATVGTTYEHFRTFALPSPEKMTYNNQNALFSLKAGVDQLVTVRIWMEGTDPACNDSLKDAPFSIRLRFTGTDENNVAFTD